MVAPNSEFGIRPCAVLLNNEKSTTSLLESTFGADNQLIKMSMKNQRKVSVSLTIKPNLTMLKNENPPNSPPSASYSRSRSASGFGVLYARSYLRCFKVRSGSQSLIGISGVKRGAMLLFNFLYALLLSIVFSNLRFFIQRVALERGDLEEVGRNNIASISSRSK
ncbi:hypothetical protein ECG_02630 [Echinococcus granulosus]|nr:hypothetical protein ECG_02630 [Echinococcus granulosus]